MYRIVFALVFSVFHRHCADGIGLSQAVSSQNAAKQSTVHTICDSSKIPKAKDVGKTKTIVGFAEMGSECIILVSCTDGTNFYQITYSDGKGSTKTLATNVFHGEYLQLNSSNIQTQGWYIKDGTEEFIIDEVSCENLDKLNGLEIENNSVGIIKIVEYENYVGLSIFKCQPQRENGTFAFGYVVASNETEITNDNIVVGNNTEITDRAEYIPVAYLRQIKKWVAYDSVTDGFVEMKTIGCRQHKNTCEFTTTDTSMTTTVISYKKENNSCVDAIICDGETSYYNIVYKFHNEEHILQTDILRGKYFRLDYVPLDDPTYILDDNGEIVYWIYELEQNADDATCIPQGESDEPQIEMNSPGNIVAEKLLKGFKEIGVPQRVFKCHAPFNNTENLKFISVVASNEDTITNENILIGNKTETLVTDYLHVKFDNEFRQKWMAQDIVNEKYVVVKTIGCRIRTAPHNKN